MRIAAVAGTVVDKTWDSATDEVATAYTFPDGTQVSPVKLGWSGGINRFLEVTPFVVPAGKKIIGSPSYTITGGKAVETYQTQDIPAPTPSNYIITEDLYSRMSEAEARAFGASWAGSSERLQGLLVTARNGTILINGELYGEVRTAMTDAGFTTARIAQILAPAEV